VINAVTTVLGSHVNVHGCFYHVTQSILGERFRNSVKLQSTKMTTTSSISVEYWTASSSLSINSTPRVRISGSCPVPSHQPPDSATSCVSIALHRCFHRHYGTSTTRRWQTSIVPTTCVNRGTAYSPALSATTTIADETLATTAISQEARSRTASGQESQALDTANFSRDFCRSALLAAIRRKQSSKHRKDSDIIRF